MDEAHDSVGLTVRRARADLSDGLVFARLLDEAQEGWYRMALGGSAPKLVADAFVAVNHELSFEFVTMIERDGVPVGMFSAYSGSVHRCFDPSPLDMIARGRFRYGAIKRLSGRMLAFMDEIPDSDFYLRAIAVDPEQRGCGIGSTVLDVVIEAAVSSGCHRLALDVAASNSGGQRLYERIGMAVESESPRFFGLPNTNVFRMVKDLP